MHISLAVKSGGMFIFRDCCTECRLWTWRNSIIKF